MTNLINFLKEHNACQEYRDWVLAQPDQSLKAIWATCPRGDWLLWLHEEAGTPWETLEPVVYRAVNRAFEYAEIGFGLVTPENIDEAEKVAEVAGADWAVKAAGAAWAALATKAARAARATNSVAGAAWVAEADEEAEHLLCADDCRELLELPNIEG